MSQLFQSLQRTLHSLYRIDQSEDVADFRLGREHLEYFVDAGVAKPREAFLVSAGEEYTDIGLFVAEEVERRAEQFATTLVEHLDEFCVALEGVSHFVYFTFCGGQQDRPVSRVELELQAELDKFLILRLLSNVPKLLERLFVDFRLADGLDAPAQARYRLANNGAHRYARWLERRIGQGDAQTALQDARRLYRKPLASKLEHISRAA